MLGARAVENDGLEQDFPMARNADGEQAPHPGLHLFLFVFMLQAQLFFLLRAWFFYCYSSRT